MQRERTTFHEAGHAVAAYRLGIEVEFATILPARDSLGHITCPATVLGPTRAKLERAIKISLAGPMAEALFYPRYRRQLGSRDYVLAFELTRYLTSGRAREFVRHQERETKKLLKRYWKDVKRVARALLKYDELTGTAVKDIIGPRQKTEEEKEMEWIEAMAPEEPDPL